MNINDLLYNFDDDEKVLILGYAINSCPEEIREFLREEIVKNAALLTKIKREVKSNER